MAAPPLKQSIALAPKAARAYLDAYNQKQEAINKIAIADSASAANASKAGNITIEELEAMAYQEELRINNQQIELVRYDQVMADNTAAILDYFSENVLITGIDFNTTEQRISASEGIIVIGSTIPIP
jgi:acetyl-CoA acetyltransferase